MPQSQPMAVNVNVNDVLGTMKAGAVVRQHQPWRLQFTFKDQISQAQSIFCKRLCRWRKASASISTSRWRSQCKASTRASTSIASRRRQCKASASRRR